MQGEGGVLVLVLDDMQWADIPSARALLFTVRRLRHDRVLVVLTARPAALQRLGDSWQRLLLDRSRVHRLQLDGLRPSEIQELAVNLGLDPLSAGAAERLMHHTGGHPLYLRALLEELPAEALTSGAASLPAPRSLAATVLSRLGGMSDSAQELVGAAAVLGQRCPLRLAVTLAGLTDGVDSLGGGNRGAAARGSGPADRAKRLVLSTLCSGRPYTGTCLQLVDGICMGRRPVFCRRRLRSPTEWPPRRVVTRSWRRSWRRWPKARPPLARLP